MEKLDLVVIGVLVAGGAYYVASMAKQKPLPPAQNGPATPGSATPPGQTPPPGPGQPAPGVPPKAPELAQANPRKDGIFLETPELRLELSSSGASVRAATLTQIDESTYLPVQSGDADSRKAEKFQLLRPILGDDGRPRVASFATGLVGAGWTRDRIARTEWAHEALPGGGHRFTLDVEGGLRLVKTYTVPPPPTEDDIKRGDRRFDIGLSVAVENHSGQQVTAAYTLEGPTGMVDQSSDRAVRGQQAAIGRTTSGKVDVETLAATKALDLERADLAVVVPEGTAERLTFFGLETKYFAAVVLPTSVSPQRAEVRGALPALLGRKPTSDEEKNADTLAHQALVSAQSEMLVLGPGERREQTYAVYLGPKAKKIFEDEKGPYAGRGLEKLIDFGWFEFLARILLSVLGFFHWITGNYGIAIILLTFCVRAALAPLSLWSQKNVLRMQKLGPELNKLKEKYTKKDGSMTPEGQREFAAAQMGMFREHGVNPIGCVGPIFLQLPIFVGLWNALNYSFELREANFVAWISDLSVPDVLFRLPISGGLPFLGTNAFSVLPLVMVVMYYFQSALQPVPSDPRAAEQQKMMKYMLPIFGLFMYTMPSGLMIYFITSAGWSMIESKIVKAHLAKTEGVPAPVVVK
jgi:YidC/Oxa1 family membrane protein insertase